MYRRQTDLTLGELIEIIGNANKFSGCDGDCGSCDCGFGPSQNIPIGAAANEIGIIFIDGNKEAEKPLAKMLKDESWMAPCGYFYLIQRRADVSLETETLLLKFENNPSNLEEINYIKNKIAEKMAAN